MSTLQPIVKQYFGYIYVAERIRIAAGETNSSTVAILAHMCHDLTQKLTEDFLRFALTLLMSNHLSRTSIQADIEGHLETLDIRLEDTMSLVFANVLLIPQPQCDDMKRLTALLETEVKTRTSSLLSMSNNCATCHKRHARFVPGTMSSISTLRLMVSHTLKCLKTCLGGKNSSERPPEIRPRKRRLDAMTTSKSVFFHYFFESEFQKMLEKLYHLLQREDQDSSSSHMRSSTAECQRCDTEETCGCSLNTHVVRNNHSVLGLDTINNQLERIYQRVVMVDKSAGHGATNTLREEIGTFTKELTDGVYDHLVTGKTSVNPAVPEGRRLSDSGVLDVDRDSNFLNTAVGYTRVEEAVERYLQQVLLFLEMNPPQPASISINSLDTSTPPECLTAGPCSRGSAAAVSDQEDAESDRTPTSGEVKLTFDFIFTLVSKLLERLPNKSRRLVKSKDIGALIIRLIDVVLKDICFLLAAASAQDRNFTKAVKATVKHVFKTFDSAEKIVALAFRPEDTTFVDAVEMFLKRLFADSLTEKSFTRFFSAVSSCSLSKR
ncbi:unnamed protein product [Lampetra planeri]